MKFTNRPNKLHKIGDKQVWESRSVAVNGVVLIYLPGHQAPYVLASRRGPKSADFQGMMNVIAGYLDWDETGTQALYRETWEEVGLDLQEFAYPEKDGQDSAYWYEVVRNDLDQPWHVKTLPSANRQNVSLRYGFACKMKTPKFPDLSLSNNEVEGEVSEAWWMPVTEIKYHQWAFGHDELIKEYLVKCGDHIMNYY